MSALTFTIKKAMAVSAIRQALSETGELAFLGTKKDVPVVTGSLRSSGSVISNYDGIIIKYIKEYASYVERGWEGGRVWTNSFVRSNGVRVKGHYKNQPPQEGRKFIENSLRHFFIDDVGGKTQFQENVLTALKVGFVGRTVTEI